MILYDLLLFFITLLISIKKPHHLQRLFAPIPNPGSKEVIWIHAVSVGEAKAIQTLFLSLRAQFADSFFLITTTTATGQSEARRSLSSADAFAFLPVDLSWIIRRWVKALRPKLFLLVEGDYWPNLLSEIKKSGAKTLLVSGKLSKRSSQRFARVPYFARKLFSKLDLLCVQNEAYADRFRAFVEPSRIHIGGNLKLDHRPAPIDCVFWKQKLALSQPAITLACTHAPEEEELLERLPLNDYFIFLAPRHPERFEEVAQILERKQISYFRWSCPAERKGGERVLLIDAMGQLPICYALSRLAIVAGSFHPAVGGHNILEPCLYGIPVLFGPYMHAQEELVQRVLSMEAGRQVTYDEISTWIQDFFTNSSRESQMRGAATALIESSRGASVSTNQILQSFFNLKINRLS